jgi:hypothetical protein
MRANVLLATVLLVLAAPAQAEPDWNAVGQALGKQAKSDREASTALGCPART